MSKKYIVFYIYNNKQHELELDFMKFEDLKKYRYLEMQYQYGRIQSLYKELIE